MGSAIKEFPKMIAKLPFIAGASSLVFAGISLLALGSVAKEAVDSISDSNKMAKDATTQKGNSDKIKIAARTVVSGAAALFPLAAIIKNKFGLVAMMAPPLIGAGVNMLIRTPVSAGYGAMKKAHAAGLKMLLLKKEIQINLRLRQEL